MKDSLSFKTNTNNLNDNSKITHHGGYDIIDHAFGPRFPSQLLKELQSNGWIDDPAHGIKGRLNPARTKTDVDMAKLLNGFVNPFLENNGNDSVGSSDVSSNSNVGPIGVRGDESAFISRKDRSDFAFPDKNPCLHHLVSSIESTAFRRLGKPHAAIDHTAKGATKIEENNNGNTATTAKKSETSIHFEFDKTLTSVQIAKYPCDGQAGYPRHCDRGNACLKEPIANHLPLDKQEKGAERILTFIYYLTPSEWDGDLDGGALRIFSPCQNDVIAASMQNDDECGCDGCHDGSNKQTASSVDANYFDVVPYSDRMVAFRSDVIEHQVMPSLRRERIAITVWLYGRAVQAGANSAKLIPNYFCLKGDTKVENAGRATNSTDESGIEEVPDTAKKLSNNVSSYPPPLPLPKDKNQNKTIFVAIPSYRDEETWPTIKSLIQTACYPERIYIGVVWQIDTLSQDEMQYFMNGKNMIESLENLFSLGSVWRYNKNVRSITLDYRQATGA